MRGKITYYNQKTGIGVITNQHKKNFEFRKNAWHDFNKIPTKGMFVNIRVDEFGKVLDCRESIFNSLKKDYKLLESDFWNTEDDFELLELIEAKKEWLITKNLNSLEPKKPIEPTKSIDECFDLFFNDDILLVYKYQELLLSENKQKLDYFRLKRFIQKAKTHLLATDSTINPELFSEIEQELRMLEQSYIKILKRLNIENKDAFNEIFLPYQIEYLRYQRKLQLDKERLFQITTNIKKLNNYVAIHKPTTEAEKEKFEKIKSHLEGILKEKEKLEYETEILKKQIAHFESKYFNEFVTIYNFEREQKRLFDYIQEIADILAYRLDTLIWEKAVNSESIKNSFYKNKNEGAFCTITFLRYYLKSLNKNNLSQNDDFLNNYLKKYEKEFCFYTLLVSENSELIERLKVVLLETDKNILVFPFLKALEALHWLKVINNSVDLIIIDSSMKTVSAIEFIRGYFDLKKKKNSKFLILSLLNDKEEIEKLATHGIKHFVKKPIINSEIKEKVLELMQSKALLKLKETQEIGER